MERLEVRVDTFICSIIRISKCKIIKKKSKAYGCGREWMKYNCRMFRSTRENWEDLKKLEQVVITIESKTLAEAKDKACHEAQMLDMQSDNKIVQKIEIEVEGEWQPIPWI
jgi:hypothetical protein